MKLYCLPGACSLADHIVLEWIGKPYEVKLLGRDELKSPAYLAINPAASVPAFVDDDGWVLTENVAILNYLADRFPEAGLAGDGTPRGRAEVNRWLAFINSDLHKSFVPLFAPHRFLDDEGQHEALQNKARQNVRGLLERGDRHLADQPWLAGEERSIADPYLYVVLRWAAATGVDTAGLEHLATFQARLAADPGVQTALRAEGQA